MTDETPSEKNLLEKFGVSSLVEATGSNHSDLQVLLIQQLLETLWLPTNSKDEETDQRMEAAIAALIAIRPQDALEGSLAVQMVAVHNAALGCLTQFVGAQHSPQRFEYIKQAERLMSLYLRQLETLDKHRGIGVARVNVENVNVQAGGQAVVGHVQTERMLARPEVEVSPPGKALEHKPVETLDPMPAAPVRAAARTGRHGSP
jgi:hypothetical protein